MGVRWARGEVIGMRHLRAVNGSCVVVPSARRNESEICFIDYASCPNRDTCWVLDLGSGCNQKDGCIIDTN
jgi:hypothetical protein